MSCRLGRCTLIVCFAAFLTGAPRTHAILAGVEAGWDLFQTTTGSNFLGIPLEGVPLGNFDFGGTIGSQPVGPTDTIVQRMAPASPSMLPGAAPNIPIELVALQLRSTAPVTVIGSITLPMADFMYITLQSDRPGGGTPSQGQMGITFSGAGNGGTFDSFFDVFYDLRVGSLTGPIIYSDHLTLTGDDNAWNRQAPPGAIVINGVNNNLNGFNNSGDFWPIPPVVEQHPTLGAHVVTPAAIPEVSAFLCGGLALGLAAVGRSWRGRKSSAAVR
jgi:hypothetical protein